MTHRYLRCSMSRLGNMGSTSTACSSGFERCLRSRLRNSNDSTIESTTDSALNFSSFASLQNHAKHRNRAGNNVKRPGRQLVDVDASRYAHIGAHELGLAEPTNAGSAAR